MNIRFQNEPVNPSYTLSSSFAVQVDGPETFTFWLNYEHACIPIPTTVIQLTATISSKSTARSIL